MPSLEAPPNLEFDVQPDTTVEATSQAIDTEASVAISVLPAVRELDVADIKESIPK